MLAGGLGFRVCSENVSVERLDGDVIAVNLSTGAYFSMSGCAADVWTAFASGADAQACMALLDDAFSIAVPRDDVESLLQGCIDAGLLEQVSAPNRDIPPLPDDWNRASWSRPSLEVYDDLQDLILVDPIHETSDLGWPAVDSPDD